MWTFFTHCGKYCDNVLLNTRCLLNTIIHIELLALLLLFSFSNAAFSIHELWNLLPQHADKLCAELCYIFPLIYNMFLGFFHKVSSKHLVFSRDLYKHQLVLFYLWSRHFNKNNYYCLMRSQSKQFLHKCICWDLKWLWIITIRSFITNSFKKIHSKNVIAFSNCLRRLNIVRLVVLDPVVTVKLTLSQQCWLSNLTDFKVFFLNVKMSLFVVRTIYLFLFTPISYYSFHK